MQNEEKNRLEERIIQHFDGSLSGEESKSLLREVAESTEKRALFKSYETLNKVISAARIPMELPVEAKNSIAERIPGLLAFIPGLIGTAETLPIVTQSANPFVAFFTKMSLSTAVSIGTGVAVLTTAGVVVKNKLDDNAAHEKAKIAVVHNQQQANPSAPMYATLPGHDLTTTNVGSGTTAAIGEGATKDIAGSAKTNLSQRTHQSLGTSSAHVPSSNNAVEDIPSATNASQSQLPPEAAVSAVAAKPVAPVSANIPDFHPTSFASLPLVFSEGLAVRPFVSVGGRVQFVSADHDIAGLTPNDGNAASDLRLGVDIAIIDNLGLRLQGGNMQISRLVDRAGTPKVASLYNGLTQEYVNYTTVNLENAYWATAGLTYHVYATDAIPLTFSVSGGAAFLSTTAPMAELGLSTELAVSSHLMISPGVSYDAVWTTTENLRGSQGVPGNAILVDRGFNRSTLFSSSLGLTLGFQYHF